MLSEPRQLIIPHQDAPQLIRVVIPHQLVMTILHNGLNLNQVWTVSPQTYPVNGIISQFSINELPHSPKNNDRKDGLFLIIGIVMFRVRDKIKILTKNNQQIIIQGNVPKRYKQSDTLYIKARLVNQQLHLINCCSDLEYAIKKKKQPFSFTLTSYPQLLPSLAQKTKQFWAPYGSEKIAVILNYQNIEKLAPLKRGQCIAHVSGEIENICGITSLPNPSIKITVKLFSDSIRQDELRAKRFQTYQY